MYYFQLFACHLRELLILMTSVKIRSQKLVPNQLWWNQRTTRNLCDHCWIKKSCLKVEMLILMTRSKPRKSSAQKDALVLKNWLKKQKINLRKISLLKSTVSLFLQEFLSESSNDNRIIDEVLSFFISEPEYVVSTKDI